jgi:uncharacterized protein (DUF983 family)
MWGRGSKVMSIVRMKCPRCQKGRFFEGSPYQFDKMGIVKESCVHCRLKYEIEPGFFQGSYYVSYGLAVALFIALWILKILFLPNLTYLSTIISMVIALILFAPLLFAFSKIIWINIFVNYDSGSQK